MKKHVVIEHVHRWGGQIRDRHLWLGTIDGEVWDWHIKESLIKNAELSGYTWEVRRHHRNGKTSVIKRSNP